MRKRLLSILLLLSVALLSITLLPLMAATQTYTYSTLVDFPATGGPYEPGGLIIDAQGNLYGVSAYGGNSSSSGGDGTVYRVTPSGQLKVLYKFGSTSTDGILPHGRLARDAQGNLYGTTFQGGANGAGIVFKVSAQGVETILFSFPNGEAKTTSTGGVTLDSVGNIYGYVYRTVNSNFDGGDIFKLTPQGEYSIVYTFCVTNCNEIPNGPVGYLVNKPGGGFYGATTNTGAGDPDGIVFDLSPQGTLTTLYSFPSPGGPTNSPALDSAGNLFGITSYYHESDQAVYEISSEGVESTISSLSSRYGYNGFGPPILDAQGNLYDTTEIDSGQDVVFEVSTSGQQTTLYVGNSIDPEGVVMDSAGNLYGTSSQGGRNRTGSIGKLTKISE